MQQKLEMAKLDEYFLPQVADLFTDLFKHLQNTKDFRSRL